MVAVGQQQAETGELSEVWEEVDCTGCVLVPGLVDLHTHLYQHATPLGTDPQLCLARS